MIQLVSGDILLTLANAIAHGVAPFDHFNQGLALALREQWPAMVKDFRHWCHNQSPQPGEVWQWVGAGGPRIFNLLTQESADSGRGGQPGRARLDNVNHALKVLRRVADSEGITSLAMPRLATGVGGLEWAPVKELIERHFGDAAYPVFVYHEYYKGVVASEEFPAGVC